MTEYPIKYAIMPVTTYAKNDDIILGYIVTKVFLILELHRYLPNGVIKSSYDVVYPVKGLKSSEVMADIRMPEFDQGGLCINADHNNNVFDTFEDAKKVCAEMNNALFRADIANYTARTDAMQDFELKVLERTFIIPNPEDNIEKSR